MDKPGGVVDVVVDKFSSLVFTEREGKDDDDDEAAVLDFIF